MPGLGTDTTRQDERMDEKVVPGGLAFAAIPATAAARRTMVRTCF